MEESVLVGHDVGSQVAFVSVGEASPCCVRCLVLGRVPVVVDLEERILVVD